MNADRRGKYDFSSLHFLVPLKELVPLHMRHVDLQLFERDGMQHYATIRNISRLVGRQLSNHGHTDHCCRRCLHAYSSQELLNAHALDCCHVQRNKFPKDPKCRFTNIQKQLLSPFVGVVYADFESILQRVGDEAMDTTQGVAVGGDEPTPAGPIKITSHAALHTSW